MTIAVDTVITHEQLADYVGGSTELANMLPPSWSGASTKAREHGLKLVTRSLFRRTPPIRESDLTDVTQLRDAVAYGALAFLYDILSTSPDDIWEARRKRAQDRYQSEVSGLTPTLNGEQRGTVHSIGLSRR